jgi:hypothetical protein
VIERGEGGSASAASPRREAAAFLLDAVLVVLFAALGRRTHGHGDSLRGVAATAGPFLVGLVVGWVVRERLRGPLARTLSPWLGAWLVGLLARGVVGQGVDAVFVAVAGAFLGLFLLGWRALARLSSARRRR